MALGDGYQTGAEVVNRGGSVAAASIATAAKAGSIAAGTASVAIPLIGAGVFAVTMILSAISKRNAQKRAATGIVNEVEPQLAANLSAYMAGPRTKASQAQALANFEAGWQLVTDNCGRPDLGAAGERCISERGRDGRPSWGKNWFELYRDPIAEDQAKEETAALIESLTAAETGGLSRALLSLAAAGLIMWGFE